MVCTLDRYMLTRSRVARCLASNAVAVGGVFLSRNENGKKPGRDGLAAAGGGGTVGPDGAAFFFGDGVGSGTFSAKTCAVASTVQIVAASIVIARRPAICALLE